MAQAGRQPDSAVTVAQLLDRYVSTAGWDVSTRESNLGYIRRTIKPALGSLQVRKVRGPILDTLYARLMRCGNLACAGKPFIEHRNIPDPRPGPADGRLGWKQAADRVRAAIRSGHRPPVTPCCRCPTSPGSKGSNPAPYGTRSWRSRQKVSCTSATDARRRSQASRPLTILVRAARSFARFLATTASCPAAARTSASPWPRKT